MEMRKLLFGLLVVGLVGLLLSGCQQTGEIPAVLKIVNRSPALDASGVSASESLSITVNFPLNLAGATENNLFTDYLAFGSSHAAGNPTITSLTLSSDHKMVTIVISGWSVLSGADAKAAADGVLIVHIIPRTNKIKDIFNNVLLSATSLWKYSLSSPAPSTSTTTTTTTTTTSTTTTTRWQSYNSSTVEDLFAVHSLGDFTTYAVGNNGVAIRFISGAWSDWSPSTSESLNDIHHADDTVNYRTAVVGNVGTFLATTNYSSLGTAVSITPEALYGVRFSNDDLMGGWAVGANGLILNTTDAAGSWVQQNSNTNEKLNRAHFQYSNYGWVVGDNGTIRFTSNGGTAWLTQNSGVSENLNAVYQTGFWNSWIVGDNGTILYSTNPANGTGATWTPQASGVSENLYGVYFLDAQEGWVVGSNGVIIHTTNAGTSWVVEGTGTTSILYDVHFSTSAEGWAVGAGGTALKYIP
jgi:photosystem II stability/assembly factor-like uncharacterized protein